MDAEYTYSSDTVCWPAGSLCSSELQGTETITSSFIFCHSRIFKDKLNIKHGLIDDRLLYLDYQLHGNLKVFLLNISFICLLFLLISLMLGRRFHYWSSRCCSCWQPFFALYNFSLATFFILPPNDSPVIAEGCALIFSSVPDTAADSACSSTLKSGLKL